jgi:hypothetical protein
MKLVELPGAALLLVAALLTSCTRGTMFTRMDPAETGVYFVNQIRVRDTLNILDNEFIYNGGGVAVGDLNGDGLPDIVFTANLVANRLYLNRGDFRFDDVTEPSGFFKDSTRWSAGVTLVDINRDNRLDIYVSNTMSPNPEARKNYLFVNQGTSESGVPIFREMASAYGLDHDGHDSASAFFDYDNDGDLDVVLAINYIDRHYPNQYVTRLTDGTVPNREVLLRNDYDSSLNHAVFRDVSPEAGLVFDGYSHSLLTHDFNNDGWTDIYVCNDYLSNDLLYINNQDGTFTNRIRDVFKHESLSAMGSDLADIDNDGRADLFVSEMMPVDNKRKKLFLNAGNYSHYIFTERYDYEYQFTRNSLSLNRGMNPATGLPLFSDIAFFAGVQETEWSWTSLLADFDNDGYRDILVTNGFPKDVTDHDFGAFRSGHGSLLVSKQELYDMIPEIKVQNVLFRNGGDRTFEDVTGSWGLSVPSFSNGAAYADLDIDGDLDFVVNNINDPAFIYRNNVTDGRSRANYLRVKLIGTAANPVGIGATVEVRTNGKIQTAEVLSGRGYLSSSEQIVHFGLAGTESVESLIVRWPTGHISRLSGVAANQTIEVSISDARTEEADVRPAGRGLLRPVRLDTMGLDFLPPETDFIDFNFQRTLPHKFSQYGPPVAVGDVNGDGLEDLVFGGSARVDETVFLQRPGGTFDRSTVSWKPNYNKKEEDVGILLFDADGDGDNDIYLARGSYQHEAGSVYYQHLICVNDGRGNFRIDSLALNRLRTCGGAVKAADYDRDGDLDLFVGGRVLPRAYPKPDRSYLLRNDTRNADRPVFVDVTEEVAPGLSFIGMISDALWTDFDNDGWIDIVLAGEWMPLTFLRNTESGFTNVTDHTGVSDRIGWWNSLAGGDFDKDGDIDYIAGNFGLNTYFQCSDKEPLTLYAKDFDNNGLYDPFISCYWRGPDGRKAEYFYHTRDDMIKQLVLIRAKFEKYGTFGEATASQVFTDDELAGADIYKANWMASSFVENLGKGKFRIAALPAEAQFAPLYGILPADVNDDGILDLVSVGNDFGMELIQGRADALNGEVAIGDGSGAFVSVGIEESHFLVPGDARALVHFMAGGKRFMLATQSRDSIRVFARNAPQRESVSVRPAEIRSELVYRDGSTERREFYWGSTFGSHTSRSVEMSPELMEVRFYDCKGIRTRTLKYDRQ